MSRGSPESFCVSSQKVNNLHHEQDERYADASAPVQDGLVTMMIAFAVLALISAVLEFETYAFTGAVLSLLVGLHVDDCFSLPSVKWYLERERRISYSGHGHRCRSVLLSNLVPESQTYA